MKKFKLFLNSKTAKFPFNNRGEIPLGGETPPQDKTIVTPITQAESLPAREVPKTKEEWDNLANTDPKRWIALTQPRMDQAVRESREWREKATQHEHKYKNLELELNTIRKNERPKELPAGEEETEETESFSITNLPKNDMEWDRLFIEDPKLATDLRVEQKTQQRMFQERQNIRHQEVAKKRKEAAKELWDRHPDMFIPETETDGTTKKDGNGKPVFKIDPNTNAPILNLEHEKGQLFVEVYSKSQDAFDSAPNGPLLAMLAMEHELTRKGMQKMAESSTLSQNRTPLIDQRGVLPGGITPPVTTKVSFSTDAEKAHAEQAVQRGIYKSLSEYCQLRDGKNTGFTEENRIPKFK